MKLFILGFAALLGRSLYLQSFHKRFLQEKGDARYNRTLVLPSQRGKITDRHGELLAISSPVESIWRTHLMSGLMVIKPKKSQIY